MKPYVIGNSPSDLSPRRSFAQWHQIVEGTSSPWTSADIATARMISASVADVVLQFRSLRLLIVQDQLAKIRRQIRLSDQLTIVADGQGRILMASKPFWLLAGEFQAHLQTLLDLPQLFLEPDSVRDRLAEMTGTRNVWRGEVVLRAAPAGSMPLMVRGEPVFSGPETLLGYMLLFTDMSDQKAADAARKQSIRSIVETHELIRSKLGSKDQLDYLLLLSLVVGNAQRATLEITDGIDIESMPQMIQSVRSSVVRTAELLENLIAYAGLPKKRL